MEPVPARMDGDASRTATVGRLNSGAADFAALAAAALSPATTAATLTADPSTTTPALDADESSASRGDTDHDATSSPQVSSPPYWQQAHHSQHYQHQRSTSNYSVESFLAAGAIRLEDNTDGEDDKNRACWAKGAYIEDHVVVGTRSGVGAFVVWNVTVETLNGGLMRICKRYSEFDELRERLLQTFPNSKAAMPPLPPKSVISKFRPRFLEQRRIGLSYFLNCILLNPEFSGSPVLKEFLFS